MKSFTSFLKTKIEEDSPIGDFATDWFRDKNHKKSSSFKPLFNYMIFKTTNTDVLQAFVESYKEYIDYIFFKELER